MTEYKIESVNMGQAVTVASRMISLLVDSFCREEDTDEEKTKISYIAIAVFLHQFCGKAKYRDKMITVLEAVIEELREK